MSLIQCRNCGCEPDNLIDENGDFYCDRKCAVIATKNDRITELEAENKRLRGVFDLAKAFKGSCGRGVRGVIAAREELLAYIQRVCEAEEKEPGT